MSSQIQSHNPTLNPVNDGRLQGGTKQTQFVKRPAHSSPGKMLVVTEGLIPLINYELKGKAGKLGVQEVGEHKE